jgi:hypothetical protein
LGDLARCEEDVVSYALYPQIAREFFLRRQRGDAMDKGIVAALAAALIARQPASPPSSVPPAANGCVSSAWMQAARAGLQGPWTGLL